MKFLSVILILAMAVLSCSKKKAEDVFVYCSEGSPEALNPQITTSGTSNDASGHTVYNRLIDFKYGTTEIEPSLAESWTVSEDKLVFTFKLRKGVRFHTSEFFTPTRDFNADDVLFSINRQRLKDHNYAAVGGGNYEYFNSMEMGSLIKDVRKIDDYTVEISLTRVEAPFISNMAMAHMSILSQEYADNLEKIGQKERIDMFPVGTGPFVFKSYAKDTMIRFESNPTYFEGEPKIKKLVFAITPDPSVRVQKLRAGECDLVIEPPPAELAALKSDSKLQVLEIAGLNIGYLAMNTEKAPLGNKKVREAINLALNRENYINAIYLGNAVRAINPLPPNIWSYNSDIKDFPYDVEKAKQLLAEAGVKLPLKLGLWTLPVTRPYNPNGKKMGELMQADLQKIGIEVRLVTYDWPTYLAKSRKGEHQLFQFGWTGDNGDPDNFMHVLNSCVSVSTGSNVYRWCNKEYDDLVMRAKQTLDLNERTQLYKKAQVVFRQELPWAPIANSVVFRAMKSNVKGYKMDPFGGDIFAYVYRE